MKINFTNFNFRELDIRGYLWVPIGLLLSAIFLVITSIQSFPLNQLIHERGSIQFFSVTFGAMVLAFSLLKMVRIFYEKNNTRSFIKSYVNYDVKDIEQINQIEILGKGILFKRFSDLILIWKDSNSRDAVLETIDSNSDGYDNSLSASYLIPKLFVWAIPIFGFIGTVMGIGSAVSQFDSFLGKADEIAVLKDGLVEVTKGLGTAFDTTFLALLISLLAMLPMTLAERTEQRLLNKIDFFLRSVFLNLLPDKTRKDSKDIEIIKNATIQSKLIEKQLKQIEGSGQIFDTFRELKETLKALEKTLIEASRPKKLVFMETKNEEQT